MATEECPKAALAAVPSKSDQRINDAAKKSRHQEWKLANRENIAAYNALVEREGVFSDGLRLF